MHALRSRDLPVRALARKPERESKLRSWNVELVQGDMTDPESLKRAVNGVDTVVHLVAIRQGKPEQFHRIMIEGTRSLLDAAKTAGVKRFVLMSALGTTDETKDVVPYYGAKWAEEQDVKASGIPYVIFRPSFIFGEGGGILPTFAKLAKIGPVTAVTGKGTQRIQPIWIDDLGAVLRRGGHARRRRSTGRGSWAAPSASTGTSSGRGCAAPSASNGGRPCTCRCGSCAPTPSSPSGCRATSR